MAILACVYIKENMSITYATKWAPKNHKRQKARQARKLPLNTCTRTKKHTKLILGTCHRAKSKQAHMLPLSTCPRAKEHTKLTLNPCDREKPQTKRAAHKASLTWNPRSLSPKWCTWKSPWGEAREPSRNSGHVPKQPESNHQMFSMPPACKVKSENKSKQTTQHWG